MKAQMLGPLAGEVPMDAARTELYVSKDLAQRALDIIADAQRRDGPERICDLCGETSRQALKSVGNAKFHSQTAKPQSIELTSLSHRSSILTTKRPVLAIIGTGRASTDGHRAAAYTLGKLAVDHGFRIVTGGLDGVMEAACQGAHSSDNYREGATIGILPDSHDGAANRWVDNAIPTGMGLARNVLVIQSADVVVAVGGGSGTLSEIAFAWHWSTLIAWLHPVLVNPSVNQLGSSLRPSSVAGMFDAAWQTRYSRYDGK